MVVELARIEHSWAQRARCEGGSSWVSMGRSSRVSSASRSRSRRGRSCGRRRARSTRSSSSSSSASRSCSRRSRSGGARRSRRSRSCPRCPRSAPRGGRADAPVALASGGAEMQVGPMPAPAADDPPRGGGASNVPVGVIRRAAALRMKYRKYVNLLRIPVLQIGPHPDNRDGQAPSGSRCLELTGKILSVGFDAVEVAWCGTQVTHAQHRCPGRWAH